MVAEYTMDGCIRAEMVDHEDMDMEDLQEEDSHQDLQEEDTRQGLQEEDTHQDRQMSHSTGWDMASLGGVVMDTR